ncbi:4'-phosphopantetheinyl transferase family protein [Moheibacter sp.]|jgi:phosphopantetheinyl transferase|uniref:4'-phosphopantetheinyl transferase family protein n=1 Tax=Moheibacter sp. TaxID=1965316 RepID=UPI00169A4754|nr:4'-phosphopantetheinyl transferase superfamily protein [Flavobacteriaceae bacterium]
MPLINSLHHDEFTRIVGWKTTESDEELLEYLQLSPYRIMKYLTLGPKQAKEYLGLRACLKELDLDFDVYYHKNGKPYLPSSKQLSITHSFDMVCIGLSKFNIGIDIEKSRPHKILNIKEKFIREDEADWIPKEREEEYLHVIWGIKEGLYKLNGGNLWNFLHHYRVEPFELKENTPISSWISDERKSEKFISYYTKVEDYYLVWVLDVE